MTKSTSMEIQPANASINNEDQNTQKEADIPGGNEKKNDELVNEIRKIVERPEIEPSKQCRIYKVPPPLRDWNKEAYTPRVVSIGPFHHKNERLKAMEEHKERYFRSFLQRSKINLEYLVGVIREMEESIRGCYEETIDLTSDRFVKMILLDVIFILELFIRGYSTSQIADDPNVVGPRSIAVMLDLLLLENQLPFFVIEKLYNLACPDHLGLLRRTFYYFRCFNVLSMAATPNVKIEHFTDLIRTFHVPPPEKQPERKFEPINHLYSATQLHEAGVKFEAGRSGSYFDIRFENGVLKIPRMALNDMSEIVTRNIMAFEQTRVMDNAYFTDFFFFMGLLINAKEDVDLLCDKNILVNHLGDKNNAATLMINNLNKVIVWASVRYDYIYICEELNRFYEQRPRRHRWMAVLKREFFSTLSAATSTIITVVVITVLTLIQTVCSVMQVTDSSRKAV